MYADLLVHCDSAEQGQQNYTGGNPTSEVYAALPDIRSFIFQNGTGSKLRRNESRVSD